jgi:hypothetical protein
MNTATLRHDRNNPIELPAEFLDELWPATPERPVAQDADRMVAPEPRRGSAPPGFFRRPDEPGFREYSR